MKGGVKNTRLAAHKGATKKEINKASLARNGGGLSPESPCEGNVFRHNCHTLGVDCREIRVFEKRHHISLGCLLQCEDGCALESKVGFHFGGDFSHEPLERKLSQQKLGRLLVTADFSQSHSARAKAVVPFDTASRGRTLAGGLRREFLSGRFAAGRLSRGLLCAGHCLG